MPPMRCANCKSYITEQELALRKPPAHPWRLTPEGERRLQAAGAGAQDPRCPECGQPTLVR